MSDLKEQIVPHPSSMMEPLPSDVLLGRAAKVFHHSGNKRYRTIIAMNIPLYKRAATKLDKMVLIKQVTEQVIDQGRVQFLRQDGKTSHWKPVAFRIAQDKVSHALRDGISKPLFHAKKIGETSPVGVSLPRIVVATEKKKIDPLALLAATSQMKMPLPDTDAKAKPQTVSTASGTIQAQQTLSGGESVKEKAPSVVALPPNAVSEMLPETSPGTVVLAPVKEEAIFIE